MIYQMIITNNFLLFFSKIEFTMLRGNTVQQRANI